MNEILHKHKHLFSILTIIAFGFLAVLPLTIKGVLFSGSDMGYHLNRIYEIYKNLQHGHLFTYLSTYSLNQIGIPANMVYGFLPCYIIALPMLLIPNHIMAIYIGIALILIMIMLIAYSSGLMYWKGAKISLLFAISYGLSNYLFDFGFGTFDLGQFCAAAFLPLAFYSTYNLFFEDGRKWYLLPLSLGGIIYTHIISTLMVCSLLALIFIIAIFVRSNLKYNVSKILYAAILSITLTSFYWYNILKVITSNITITKSVDSLSGNTPGYLFSSIMNNQTSIGFAFFIILLVSLVMWNQLNKKAHVVFYILFIYTFMISSLSNCIWESLGRTPLKEIQFTGRFIWIINFLSAILVTETINILLKSVNIKYQKHIWFLTLCIPLFLFWSNAVTFINANNGEQLLNYQQSEKRPLPFQHYKIENNKQFMHIVSKNYTGVGSLDYFPKNAYSQFHSLTSRQMIVNQHKTHYRMKSFNNGITYKLHLKTGYNNIDLPFLKYSKLNYIIRFNGHKYHYNVTNRGTIGIDNFSKDSSVNSVSVSYQRTTIQMILSILSVISFITLAFMIIANVTR